MAVYQGRRLSSDERCERRRQTTDDRRWPAGRGWAAPLCRQSAGWKRNPEPHLPMNDLLWDRILRKLNGLSDVRLYQVLDYVEFLESRYTERQAPPPSVFSRFAEGV